MQHQSQQLLLTMFTRVVHRYHKMDQYLDICTNKLTPFSIEVYAPLLTHDYHILYHDAAALSTLYAKMLVCFICSNNHGSLSSCRKQQSSRTRTRTKKDILSSTSSHTSFVYWITSPLMSYG